MTQPLGKQTRVTLNVQVLQSTIDSPHFVGENQDYD
jgi:hypothetical protein